MFSKILLYILLFIQKNVMNPESCKGPFKNILLPSEVQLNNLLGGKPIKIKKWVGAVSPEPKEISNS